MAQERPWSPTATRPEGKGQEETRGDKTRGERTRADKTSGRTRQQTDNRFFRIHDGRGHFTRRQLTRAFKTRWVHFSIRYYLFYVFTHLFSNFPSVAVRIRQLSGNGRDAGLGSKSVQCVGLFGGGLSAKQSPWKQGSFCRRFPEN